MSAGACKCAYTPGAGVRHPRLPSSLDHLALLGVGLHRVSTTRWNNPIFKLGQKICTRTIQLEWNNTVYFVRGVRCGL